MTVPEGSIANKVCSKIISTREYSTAILPFIAYLYLNIAITLYLIVYYCQ
jgi:hypothetical protein